MTHAVAPVSVLLVDPCPDTTATLTTLLELAGFAVHAVSTGMAALHHPLYAPDVVILELELPVMGGCELAERFADRPYPPWLVAYTARSGDDDVRRSADAGVHLHLVKPADPTAVVNAILRFSGIPPARKRSLPTGTSA